MGNKGKVKEEMNKTKNKSDTRLGIVTTIALMLITAIITYFVTVNVTIKSYLSKANSAYMTAKMSLIKNKLESTYMYDVDDEKMMEGAIKGYVAGLGDKYTQYLTPDEFSSLFESTTGTYVGIGVYIGNSTKVDGVVVAGIVEGSVAEKAGIQAGDIIIKVDDKDYSGQQTENVAAALKGSEGTKVKVTVSRDGSQKEFELTKASIKVKTVASQMLDDQIGYINIASFDDGTADEFKKNYNDLKSKNPKGLVIDLRNNGGGVVTESLQVADTMVEKNKTLLITTDKEGKEHVDSAKENPIVDIPVVLLVNKGTASASEILAASLRDNCNYKIIGLNTYGKGVIQSVFSFADGSAVKVTTNEYFSPNHNVINNVGITPDIEVEQDEEWNNVSAVPFEHDKQLQKAIEELKK